MFGYSNTLEKYGWIFNYIWKIRVDTQTHKENISRYSNTLRKYMWILNYNYKQKHGYSCSLEPFCLDVLTVPLSSQFNPSIFYSIYLSFTAIATDLLSFNFKCIFREKENSKCKL